MKLDVSDLTLLVIAGGNSRRMGKDKRFLSLSEGETLLSRILRKAAGVSFSHCLLCVAEETPELRYLASHFSFRLVVDRRNGCGPLEGLRAGLAASPTDWVLAVSADQPFLDFSLAGKLLAAGEAVPEAETILPRAGGRKQPLFALYRKSLADCFDQALQEGERKIGAVLHERNTVVVGEQAGWPESAFFNVNTRADLALARGRQQNLERRLPIITISAPHSNTGKTTFIERVLPRLKAAGLRVGIVKGDAHGYTFDTAGKDSSRFRQAGADAVAVASPDGYFIEQRTEKRANLAALAARFAGIDLVLVESRAHGPSPVIALCRDDEPFLREGTAAIFSKPHVDGSGDSAQYDLDDIDAAAKVIVFLSGLSGK